MAYGALTGASRSVRVGSSLGYSVACVAGEVQRSLVAGGGAARVRGGAAARHGRSAAAAGVERTAPHAPACHASGSMRLPLLPLLVLPLVLARPAAGEPNIITYTHHTTHHSEVPLSLLKFCREIAFRELYNLFVYSYRSEKLLTRKSFQATSGFRKYSEETRIF